VNQEPATILDFLSPDLAAPDLAPAETAWRSPLERALADAPGGLEDISRTGILEIRGDLETFTELGAELVSITPTRGLLLCDADRVSEIRQKVRQDFLAIDVSAGWAGLRVKGEQLLRRLTDLDLEALPAVGSVGHVQALVIRDEGETFRLFFPQEYGHSVAEIILDALEGISSPPPTPERGHHLR
jgi:hypothetical protein